MLVWPVFIPLASVKGAAHSDKLMDNYYLTLLYKAF